MAAVPFPLMSGFHGEEIGRSLVFHSLWEPQQDSVVQLSHPRMIRRPGGNNTGRNVLKYHQYVRKFPAFFCKPSSLHTLGCARVYMERLPVRIDCSGQERISGSCQICLHHVRLKLPDGSEASTPSDAGSKTPSVNLIIRCSQVHGQKMHVSRQRVARNL